MSKPIPFMLRWRGPGDAPERDVIYSFTPDANEGPQTGLNMRQWVNLCIDRGLENGKTYIGEVDEKTGVAVALLSRTEYRKLAARDDKGQLVLEGSEGQKEVWVERPLLADKPPYGNRLIQVGVVARLYEFQRKLNAEEYIKLTRRWRGIEPDEDADLDVDSSGANLGHETEAPRNPAWALDPQPRELPGQEVLARELADKAGASFEEHSELFLTQAAQRLAAMTRAPVLNVPDIEHDQIQEAVVLARDPETGEMSVTHTYHDLHAPEGELTTEQMSAEAHEMVAGLVAVLALEQTPMQTALNTVASKVRPGQFWKWGDIETEARKRLPASMKVGPLIDAGDAIDIICLVLAQEQDNAPQHGWKVSWPGGEIHMAPHADAMTLCDHKLGGWLWILPVRFKQCGPVPFGPMCEGCVKTLETMSPDDPRLVPPDCNCEEMRAIMMLSRFDRPEDPGDPTPGWKCPVHGNVELGLDLDGAPIDTGAFEWVTYENADPVRDIIVAHLQGMQAPTTEENVRDAVRYYKAKGLFGDKVDEDGAVARVLAEQNPPFADWTDPKTSPLEDIAALREAFGYGKSYGPQQPTTLSQGEAGNLKRVVGVKRYSVVPPELFGSEGIHCGRCTWAGMHRHADTVGSKGAGWKSACPECKSTQLFHENGDPVNKEGHNTNSKEAVDAPETDMEGGVEEGR